MVGDNSGTLSGNINGMAGVEVLTPTRAQACAYDITATVTGTSVSGTWASSFNCMSPDGGTIAVTKQ